MDNSESSKVTLDNAAETIDVRKLDAMLLQALAEYPSHSIMLPSSSQRVSVEIMLALEDEDATFLLLLLFCIAIHTMPLCSAFLTTVGKLLSENLATYIVVKMILNM